MDRLHRLARLSPRGWAGLATAYGYLLAASWRLYVLRQPVDRWLAPHHPAKAAPPSAGDFPEHAAAYVGIASRHPVRWAHCLVSALALSLWLRQKGFPANMCVGAARNGHGIKAHAWVTLDGRTFGENPEFSDTLKPVASAQKTIYVEGGRQS